MPYSVPNNPLVTLYYEATQAELFACILLAGFNFGIQINESYLNLLALYTLIVLTKQQTQIKTVQS